MAWTQSDLDALDKAISSGKQTVEYDGRRVVYRSMQDLFVARRLVRKSLGYPQTDGVVLPITNKDVTSTQGLVNPSAGSFTI